MDYDLLLNESRWKIVDILAKKPSSPIEIASQIKTSIAYVSQQLKLLEASGLIIKQKTGSSQKGKPRNVYSITKEIAYLTLLIKGNPSKKALTLTEHHKTILKIWLLENQDIHYYIEKLYWHLQSDLEEITSIYISPEFLREKLILISDSKKIKQKLESFIKDLPFKLNFSFLESKSIDSLDTTSLIKIYSNSSKNQNMKGGKKE